MNSDYFCKPFSRRSIFIMIKEKMHLLKGKREQPLHDLRSKSVFFSRDFMDDDSSANNIPCELCSAQISFFDYEAHYVNRSLSFRVQKIISVVETMSGSWKATCCKYHWVRDWNSLIIYRQFVRRHADDELLPCEYCSQLFGIQNLFSHMVNILFRRSVEFLEIFVILGTMC